MQPSSIKPLIITCHARKRPRGTWTGFVRATSDAPRPWTESTQILRNNRIDALADAMALRDHIVLIYSQKPDAKETNSEHCSGIPRP